MSSHIQSDEAPTFESVESSFGTKSSQVPPKLVGNTFCRFNRRISLLFVSALCGLSLHVGLLCLLQDKPFFFANDTDGLQVTPLADRPVTSISPTPQSPTSTKPDIPEITDKNVPTKKPFLSPPSFLNLVTSTLVLSTTRNVSTFNKLSAFGDAQLSFGSGTITENFDAIRDRLASYDTGRYLTLPLSDFELNQTVSETFATDSRTIFAQGRSRVGAKYFRECGNDRKRDFRFADRSTCPLHDSVQRGRNGRTVSHRTQHNRSVVHKSLVGLLRAWSKFAEWKDIDWWIAHGELLGWFWNGRFLPWDNDLDIQVSMQGLLRLATHNQTKIEGRYLVDVGTSIYVRSKQEQNVIDARIVDTKTGYFIDVTGLAKLVSQAKADANVNVVHCKTPHKYIFDDVVPLAETILEGIRVWRPRRSLKLLKEEYGETALYSAEYRELDKMEKWKFDSKLKQWVK